MSSEAMWDRARADLAITPEHLDQASLLWDHSVRVARSAKRIAALPAVQARSPDVVAIVAAALYHEAGWVVQLRSGETTFDRVLLDPVPDMHRERGAAMLQHGLAKLLAAESVARASEAIQTLDDRDIDSIEGQVLAEADHLDEFGVLALWGTVWRGAVTGRGVQAAIDTWHRRKEYRFWDARLKDSFRFPSVRAVAEQRLATFEHLMEQVEEQHLGVDLPQRVTPRSGELLAAD